MMDAMGVAPRASACSADSKTSAPAPLGNVYAGPEGRTKGTHCNRRQCRLVSKPHGLTSTPSAMSAAAVASKTFQRVDSKSA
jgi:hypothetical protein